MFLQLLTALSLLKVALAVYCDQTLTSPVGTVSSPSFLTSSFYANNLDCQYDIRVSSGYGIKLSWNTFDIKGKMPDCDDDYVEIYIGCRRSIGKYCAEYIPFDVYSPDNCLRIKFHSNSSGAGNGFQGYYSTFFVNGRASGVGVVEEWPQVVAVRNKCRHRRATFVIFPNCSQPSYVRECSSYYENSPKTLTSSSGVFSSPRWPSDYPILRDCYWRIDVDVGKNVKIAVMDLDLEYDSGCDNDKLKIKGGRSGDSYDRSHTIQNSMCGEQDPFYFTSSYRRIWIRFKSDSFRADRGFVVGYVMYDSRDTKSATITGIVVGILVPIVIIACICYVCVYRRKQAARAQQGAAAQQMTVQHPPPPPPGGYGPPPQQGYVPPPQPGYGPPPQQGYGPPQQPGYPTQAPPPYAQVAGTGYPPQDKSGPYPYPPGQPVGMSPYTAGAPPYPPGQPAAVPLYPPGQAGGVPPYPQEQPPAGVAPYPSAPSTATAPPYPPQ